MIGPLGTLDRVLNTPANHRMHHDIETSRAAVNFGILILGTACSESAPARDASVRHPASNAKGGGRCVLHAVGRHAPRACVRA
jgi:hypothetical protein